MRKDNNEFLRYVLSLLRSGDVDTAIDSIENLLSPSKEDAAEDGEQDELPTYKTVLELIESGVLLYSFGPINGSDRTYANIFLGKWVRDMLELEIEKMALKKEFLKTGHFPDFPDEMEEVLLDEDENDVPRELTSFQSAWENFVNADR
jgi:hypothetical protein